jgi:hypothetical protein
MSKLRENKNGPIVTFSRIHFNRNDRHFSDATTMAVVLLRRKSLLLPIMLSLSLNKSTVALVGKSFRGSVRCRARNSSSSALLSAASRTTLPPAHEYNEEICNHPLVGARELPQDPTRPFFPIYYNDVYEVKLPEGHRFPMEKYRKVRRLAQTLISSQTQQEQSKVVCGG